MNGILIFCTQILFEEKKRRSASLPDRLRYRDELKLKSFKNILIGGRLITNDKK